LLLNAVGSTSCIAKKGQCRMLPSAGSSHLSSSKPEHCHFFGMILRAEPMQCIKYSLYEVQLLRPAQAGAMLAHTLQEIQ
jgi:hypothetical protein